MFHVLFDVIITNELPVTNLRAYVSLPRYIRKGMLLRRWIITRGGVKDTRLKAKDTKKNPRPRTALPRTDPLEAKDQGLKRKCSTQKKGLQKNFLGDLQKKTFFKKFSRRSTNF